MYINNKNANKPSLGCKKNKMFSSHKNWGKGEKIDKKKVISMRREENCLLIELRETLNSISVG